MEKIKLANFQIFNNHSLLRNKVTLNSVDFIALYFGTFQRQGFDSSFKLKFESCE